jgi:L-2,4-diaminobutyric acid acetyltransferase
MTGDKPSHNIDKRNGDSGSAGRLEIDTPVVADGPELYRITRDSAVLDVNSSYTYLLWCRDFAQTSAVARTDGVVVGFVTGYIRPDAPDTLVVWQIAVDASQRGGGVAGRLLGHLVDRVLPRGVRYLETTITADNAASINLFTALARKRSAGLERSELFTADLFPDAHLGEDLYRIGPFELVPAAAAGA